MSKAEIIDALEEMMGEMLLEIEKRKVLLIKREGSDHFNSGIGMATLWGYNKLCDIVEKAGSTL